MTEHMKLLLAIKALEGVAKGYSEEVGGYMMEIPNWYAQVQACLDAIYPERREK